MNKFEMASKISDLLEGEDYEAATGALRIVLMEMINMQGQKEALEAETDMEALMQAASSGSKH